MRRVFFTVFLLVELRKGLGGYFARTGVRERGIESLDRFPEKVNLRGKINFPRLLGES
jgi:hypothetical protein